MKLLSLSRYTTSQVYSLHFKLRNKVWKCFQIQGRRVECYSGSTHHQVSVGLKSPVYVQVLPHMSVKCCLCLPLSALILCQASQPAQRWPGAAHCQFYSEANTLRRLMVSTSSLHIHQILVSTTPALSPAQPPHQLDWFLIIFKIPQSSALNIVTSGPSKSVVRCDRIGLTLL